MSKAIGISAVTLGTLGTIAAIIATGLPSWIIVSTEFDDDVAVLGGDFVSHSGLFQFCQVIFDNYRCMYYTGYECVGGPDFNYTCTNRRAAGGLMITGIILTAIAVIYFAATMNSRVPNRIAKIVSSVLTAIGTLFFIISMGLMIYLTRIVKWTTAMSAFGASMYGWIDEMHVHYGASFILSIVAWILTLFASILMGIYNPEPVMPKDETEFFKDDRHHYQTQQPYSQQQPHSHEQPYSHQQPYYQKTTITSTSAAPRQTSPVRPSSPNRR